MSKKCSLVAISSNGNVVKGTAAQLVYVSNKGGWDKYHKNLVTEITNKVAKELVPKIYDEIMKNMNKPDLKIAK